MKSLYTDQRDVRFMAQTMGLAPTNRATFIAEMEDGEPIAIGLFDQYNGRSVHLHIWIAVGKHPSRVFWWAMHDYPLNQLAVTNIIATVKSSNKAARKLVDHLGYKYVGMIPDYHLTGDDELIFVGLEENSTHWQKYRDGKLAPPKYPSKQLKVA